MRPIPAPLELYRHFKGNLYQIKCIAIHAETGERMAVYQAMYGDYSIYVRPLDMFMEKVDRSKYPHAEQEYRFEKVDGGVPDGGGSDSSEGSVDRRVMEFLDARTYEEKLTVLAGMKDGLTNDMLDIIAAAEDIEVKQGSIEDRYEELKNCLITLDRFECSRLR